MIYKYSSYGWTCVNPIRRINNIFSSHMIVFFNCLFYETSYKISRMTRTFQAENLSSGKRSKENEYKKRETFICGKIAYAKDKLPTSNIAFNFTNVWSIFWYDQIYVTCTFRSKRSTDNISYHQYTYYMRASFTALVVNLFIRPIIKTRSIFDIKYV